MQQKFLLEIEKFSQSNLEKQDFVAVFFTDRKRCDLNLTIENLPEKSAVIFREYDLEIVERKKLAEEIVGLCHKKNHKILIGKNLELARKLRADGAHFSDLDKISLTDSAFFLLNNFCNKFADLFFIKFLNQNNIYLKNGLILNKKNPNKKFLFSLSCHSLKSVLAVQNSGADLIFISPAFKTKSHEDAKPLGLRNLKEIARISRKPIYALGGINQKNISTVRRLGFSGFGGIDCFVKNYNSNIK